MEIEPGQIWQEQFNGHSVRVVSIEDGIYKRKPCKVVVYAPHSYKERRPNRKPIRVEVWLKIFRRIS